jgi:Arabinofuranosyltransferase N terminal
MALVLLQSVLLSAAVAIGFKDSVFSMHGIGGDMGFIIGLVNKMAFTKLPSDGQFNGLTSFYPPLYYYCCAIGSKFFGIPPYEAVKQALIISLFALPLLTFVFWKPLVGPAFAAVLPLMFVINIDFDKPASVLAMTLVTPFYLFYLQNITDRKFTTKNYVFAGLLAGLIIQVQYFWLLIALLTYAIQFISEKGVYQGLNYIKTQYKHWFLIALVAFVTASWYLVPYVWQMLTIGSEPTQNRWFVSWMAVFNFPFLQVSHFGLVKLFGLLASLYFFKTNRVAAGLVYLLLGCYVYCLLGIMGAGFGIALLHYKTSYYIEFILSLMAVHGFGLFYLQYREHAKLHKPILILGLILVAFYSQEYQINMARVGQESAKVKYPQHLSETLLQLDSTRFASKTVYSNLDSLREFFNMDFFLTRNTGYAHPASLHFSRNDFLDRLAHINDQKAFVAALMNNPFHKLDAFIFPKPDLAVIVRIETDRFPYEPLGRFEVFPLNWFYDSHFKISEANNIVAIKLLHENNPLSEVNLKNTSALDVCITDLILLGSVAPYCNRVKNKSASELVSNLMKAFTAKNISNYESLARLKKEHIENLHLSPKELADFNAAREHFITMVKTSGSALKFWEAETLGSDWQNLSDINVNSAGASEGVTRYTSPECFAKPHPAGSALFFTEFFHGLPGTYQLKMNWKSNSHEPGKKIGYLEVITEDLMQLYAHHDIIIQPDGSIQTDFEFTIPENPQNIRIRYYHSDGNLPLEIDNFKLIPANK